MIDSELAKKQIEAAVLNSSILSDLNSAQITELARLLREVFEMGFVAATNEVRLIDRQDPPRGDLLPQGNTLQTAGEEFFKRYFEQTRGKK